MRPTLFFFFDEINGMPCFFIYDDIDVITTNNNAINNI